VFDHAHPAYPFRRSVCLWTYLYCGSVESTIVAFGITAICWEEWASIESSRPALCWRSRLET
jgi:hypothetical protein